METFSIFLYKLSFPETKFFQKFPQKLVQISIQFYLSIA